MANYNTFKELADHLGIDPNHPTVADQQKVREWTEANPDYVFDPQTSNTAKYLNAKPGLFDYNTPDQPPADTPAEAPSFSINPTGTDLFARPQGATQPAVDTVSTPQQIFKDKLAKFKGHVDAADDSVSGAMKSWTPLAASAFGGVDASGEAAGYRAQAAQNAQNAAENQKIMQWNQQRASDDKLADKIAAAQAEQSRKQAAQSVGLEGGAAAAAEATKQADLDVMGAKNYQTQQMNQATQNLAEVNRNKLMQIGNETNESMTNYDTQVQEADNAYKQNLARANAEQKKDGQKKDETEADKAKDKEDKKETTDTTSDTTPDSNVQTDGHGSQAKSNKDSNAVTDATQQTSIAQRLADITAEVEGMNKAMQSGANPQQYRAKYEKLAKEYNELNAKAGDSVQKSLEPFWADNKTDIGNIADTLGNINYGG